MDTMPTIINKVHKGKVMSTKISRRDFLKGVGTMMGAVAASSVTGVPKVSAQSLRTDTNGLTIRKRKYKYPWWVKNVDKITTEVNPDIATPPPLLTAVTYSKGLISDEDWNKRTAKAKAHVKEGIVNNIPGRTLPDLALHYAVHADMTMGSMGSYDAPRHVAIENHDELVNFNHTLRKILIWNLGKQAPKKHLAYWKPQGSSLGRLWWGSQLQIQIGFTPT